MTFYSFHIRWLLIFLFSWSWIAGFPQNAEETFWEDCYYGNTKREDLIVCLKEYLRRYPNGKYADRARKILPQEKKYKNKKCQDAIAKGTVQAIRDYTFNYKEGKSEGNDECLAALKAALKKLDDKQWNKILNSPRNIKLVDAYLKDFEEEGLRFKEVQRRKQLIENPPPDDKFWAESSGKGLVKLQEYLIFSRDQKYKDKAERQIQNIELGMWNQAQANNNRSDYLKYINAFPKGQYVAEARKAIRDLKGALQPIQISTEDKLWAAVPKQNLEKLRAFIKENPNSKYVSEAQKLLHKMDEAAWQNALKSDAVVGFEKYIMDFPNGIHLQEAKEKAQSLSDNSEDEAWRQALNINTPDAYSDYLAQYPEGKYIDAAKEAIEVLREGDYLIELDGSTGDYVIQLSNVINPQLVEQPDIDSLIVDVRDLASKHVLRAQIVNLGNYTLRVKDELGKIVPIELLDLISGDMNEFEEHFGFTFNGGFQPYFLSFINNITQQEITFSDIPTQKYELAKNELSDYEGIFSVVLRDKRKTQKFVIANELPLEGNPMKRILIIGGLLTLIVLGTALWYFGYRKLKEEQSDIEDIIIEDDDVVEDQPA